MLYHIPIKIKANLCDVEFDTKYIYIYLYTFSLYFLKLML